MIIITDSVIQVVRVTQAKYCKEMTSMRIYWRLHFELADKSGYFARCHIVVDIKNNSGSG